jgi:hypothetical protein
MYAHLDALILAEYLGADVIMPPSVFRNSFSEYFSMDKKQNKVTPELVALLDVSTYTDGVLANMHCAVLSKIPEMCCVLCAVHVHSTSMVLDLCAQCAGLLPCMIHCMQGRMPLHAFALSRKALHGTNGKHESSYCS